MDEVIQPCARSRTTSTFSPVLHQNLILAPASSHRRCVSSHFQLTQAEGFVKPFIAPLALTNLLIRPRHDRVPSLAPRAYNCFKIIRKTSDI